MLSVKFDKIPEIFSESVESSVTYSVYGAVLCLSELEVMASEKKVIKTFDITIYEDEKPVYHDSLTIGNETGSELISYVEERLQELYPDKKNAIDELVTKIQDAYMDGGEVILKGATEPAKTRSEKKGTTKEKNQKVKKVKKVQKVKKDKQIKPKKPPKTIGTGVLLLGVVFLLVIGSAGSFFIFSKGSSANKTGNTDTVHSIEKKATDSLDSLLNQGKFLDAAKEYPKNLAQIEDELFEGSTVSDFEQLKNFNKKYPTEQGAFDSAYLSKDFEQVVRLKDVAKTENRKSMLAFAYLKVGNIPEAKKINLVLKSKGLDKMIASTEYLHSEIAYYTDLLTQEGLSESEKIRYEAKRNLFEIELSTIGESDDE